MTNLQVFKGANLPSVKSMSVALSNIRVDTSGGGTILKMDKTGTWVFGADQTEITDDATWAINPLGFLHGFIAWGDAVVLGEKMVAISEPLPDMPAEPAGAKRGWEAQVSLSLLCMSGEDEGMEVRYAATSVGGKRAVQELGLTIAEQIDKDESKPVPIVKLGKEHYIHKQYGKIFTPVFNVLKWIPMGGDEPAAAEEPVTTRRRGATKEEPKQETAAAPVAATEPVATGRRRRAQ